jgi:hypothetical protein
MAVAASAGDKASAASTTNASGGLEVLQGLEFLSSPASEQHDALLEDGNYFLQLYYAHEFPFEWTNFTFSGSSISNRFRGLKCRPRGQGKPDTQFKSDRQGGRRRMFLAPLFAALDQSSLLQSSAVPPRQHGR